MKMYLPTMYIHKFQLDGTNKGPLGPPCKFFDTPPRFRNCSLPSYSRFVSYDHRNLCTVFIVCTVCAVFIVSTVFIV